VSELEYSVEKAIYRNIGVISDYVDNNKDKLNIILKKMDSSLLVHVNLTKINRFHFKGHTTGPDPIFY
jgi:hypothetical protein